MARLNREQILSAQDHTTVDVEVPEWGGTITVRTLSGTERDRVEANFLRFSKGDKGTVMRAHLCAQCIVGDDGQRMFTDADIAKLGAKSASALQRVFDAAMKLNAFTKADVEELTGNSGSDQNDASTSGSPSPSA